MTRIALAGAGWAARVHTLAAASVPGVSIPTVATRSVGSAEELAAAIGARPITADRLPAKADAVIIATPPTSHAELAIRLLRGGTPVLIEKPLATTLTEADDIIAAAEAGAASACYAENLLFAPALDLAAGRRAELGALDHLEMRMTQPTPEWGHFAEPLSVGGVLFDLGVHAIAVLLVLAGDDTVEGVRARLASARDDGADDAARVEIRFASRVIAVLDIAWGADTIEWSAQAASPAGVVRVEFHPEVAVEVNGERVAVPVAAPTVVTTSIDADGTPIDPRIDSLGYRAQLDGFASVVDRKGGRACPVGFGRSVLELVCAAYTSAGLDGAEVTLPFTGDRTLTPMQHWRAAPDRSVGRYYR